MREIKAAIVTEAVANLFTEANRKLPDDVLAALKQALAAEVSEAGREVLSRILENAEISATGNIPLCQDTGLALVFVEIGQDAHVSGGDLTEAINQGVRQAYGDGYLRKSVVAPAYGARRNTGDNTPAQVHYQIVPGDGLKLTVLPKGGGAENTSRLAMLTPGDGRQGVIDFILGSLSEKAASACPPVIVGIGIGGSADRAMLMAKLSLLRPVGAPNPDPETAALEAELLAGINALGIGPMGYGGRTTALAVHVETAPAHIASLPVALNLQCHSARHRTVIL
jgi:fumarate hydratase subunit alpha